MVRCFTKGGLALLFTLALSACQSAPDPLIISPVSVSSSLSPNIGQLEVRDQRSHNYLYRLTEGQGKAVFGVTEQALSNVIQRSLAPAITSSTGNVRWFVHIDKAIIEADVDALDYTLTHSISLRVEAQHNNRRYSNTYSGQRTTEGVMTPDEAVIEREFSMLLESVLNRIANDVKLRLEQQKDW